MKLPTSVWSALGHVPVCYDATLAEKKNALGEFSFGTKGRVITLATNLPEEVEKHTLGHEIFHLITVDSGLANLLPANKQEALCDAFGTWFVGAVNSGKLVLK